MSDDVAKRGWVKQALGYDVPDGGRTATVAPPWRPREKLMPIFRDAKEAVDKKIDELQRKLREYDDEDLNQIADFGLFGVTQGQTVKLMAALMGSDQGGEDARRLVMSAVRDYQDFLAGAPIVDLLESNTFGVTVPLRAELGKALTEIEHLAAA